MFLTSSRQLEQTANIKTVLDLTILNATKNSEFGPLIEFKTQLQKLFQKVEVTTNDLLPTKCGLQNRYI